METEAREVLSSLGEGVGRLTAATTLLERTVAWLEERQASISGDVQKIVAAVEQSSGDGRLQREQQLEQKLREATEEIAELRAQAAQRSERKTLPAGAVELLAKQGIEAVESIEAGALDAALNGLSLEQRIAVKWQLLRSGMLRQTN